MSKNTDPQNKKSSDYIASDHDSHEVTIITNATRDLLLDKNPDSLILYFFYLRSASLQKTNNIWNKDTFVIRGLKWGKNRLYLAKKVLIDFNLIEKSRKRNKLGKLGKSYIKLNFIYTKKTQKNTLGEYAMHIGFNDFDKNENMQKNDHITASNEPKTKFIHSPQYPQVVKSTGGFRDTNALSNLNKNALSNLNKNAYIPASNFFDSENYVEKKYKTVESIDEEVLESIAIKTNTSVYFVEDCWESAQNHLKALGQTKKDYKAYLHNWVKRTRDERIIKEENSKNFQRGRSGHVVIEP